MKKYYCPLCGKKYDKQYNGFINFECNNCEYSVGGYISEEDAQEGIESFLSKFPPLMRLRIGDEIKYRGKIGEVFYKDLNNNVIEVYFVGKYSRFVYPADIEKFPWELEEERKLK